MEKRSGPSTEPCGISAARCWALDRGKNQRTRIPEIPFVFRIDRRIWWLTSSKAADEN